VELKGLKISFSETEALVCEKQNLECTEETNDLFETTRDAKLSVISQYYAQKLFPFGLISVVRGLKVDKFYAPRL
jgi:hypothetical protein